MKKLYLRDYEVAPEGAVVVTGRLGGRYFEYTDRGDRHRDAEFTEWFLARPKLHTVHLKAQAEAPAVEDLHVAGDVPEEPKAQIDEVAARREHKNRLERDRRARKRAEVAN